MSPWPFLFVFLLPATTLIAAERADWTWLVPWMLALLVFPGIDAFLPRDTNPAAPTVRERRRSIFTWIILAYVPVQIALTGFVLWVASMHPLPLVTRVGLVATLGLSNGGVGFTIAHELVHRTGRLEKAAGRVLLLGLAYPHWAVEHVRGHHRSVGTPRDPATARYGEIFWLFLPRTVVGQAISAWRLEAVRLRKIGRTAWSTQNEVLGMTVLEIAILTALFLWLGVAGMLFFALQVIVAVTLLEATNYCQHYGLTRREVAPGRYEPQAPGHSWNSYHRLTNRVIIDLGRHSDHHAQPGRPYQFLGCDPGTPELPASYGAMIVAALIPPLWFGIMNPRVLAWRHALAGAEDALPGEGAPA